MTETVRNESVEYETKVCPRCGAKLYADMNVCYGCLYDFSRNASRSERTELPLGVLDESPEETLDLGAGTARMATDRVGMVLRTPSVDLWVSVPAQGVTVGRAPGNDVVLHSHAVSRRHLKLVPRPEGMEVSDLGARNPLRYQGRDVRGRIVVPYGGTLDLCGCLIVMTGPPRTGPAPGSQN